MMLVRSFVFAVLAGFPCLSLAADGGTWQRSAEGCLVWNEAPQNGETVSWSGDCIAGKATGTGTALWTYDRGGRQIEVRYAGEMDDGYLDGSGVLESSDGYRIFGRWQQGKLNGEANYREPSGARYEGEWKAGRYHGKGTYYAANGSRYTGDWRDGLKHGQGVYYAANGDRYEGSWKDGKKQGIGIYYFADGNRYKGPFVDDRLHGYGECYTKFSGQWKKCEMRNGKFRRWMK